jgi:hypothetical protein
MMQKNDKDGKNKSTIDEKQLALSEKDVSLNIFKIISELSDFKFDIFLAILGSSIMGSLSPINGYAMANGINGLNSKYEAIRYNKGLKFGLVFLILAFLQGMGNCLMVWKFQSLGLTLSKIYHFRLQIN